MRSKERRELLVEELKQGKVNVDELAERYCVSASTIRRDLQMLVRCKAVARTYGGAILLHSVPETSFGERMVHYSEQKRAIARAAGALVKDGDTIILDAGSTVSVFGRTLIGRNIRVITNNLVLVQSLAGCSEIELIVVAGKCRTTSMGTFGPMAQKCLENITADFFFTSGDCLSADRGLCEASYDQVALKNLMMKQAEKTIVLADSSKINRSGQHVWAPLPPKWILVTDARFNDEYRQAYEALGCQIIEA